MPIILFLSVLSCFFLMLVIELIIPRSPWPKISNWLKQAMVFNAIQMASVILATLTWDQLLQQYSLFDCSELPLFISVAIGYFTITFIYYWWHRVRHSNAFLWRVFHQLHHSAERLELITSFFKHPFEIFANSILSSIIVYTLLGLTPLATTIVITITGISELFYHWNIKTPYWLGFIIQRPESHCIHHLYQHHHHNFSDLPIWDLLFGTFYNPKKMEFRCGFDRNKSQQIFQMLKTRDVHKLERNS